MKRLVIVAGPQASGKSTSLSRIRDILLFVYPGISEGKTINPIILQEARQIIVHKYHVAGGIFLNKKNEKEIIGIDFIRMKKILKELDESLLYFDECNIFTLAHAEAHGIKIPDDYFNRYLELLKKLHAVIIFLDINPKISWARRKESYRTRLHRFSEGSRESLLKKFQQYLEKLHPGLNKIYDRIELPKIKIMGNKKHDLVMKEIVSFLKKQEII
jgi:hypothetical protein